MDKIFVLDKKYFVLDKIILSCTNMILSQTENIFSGQMDWAKDYFLNPKKFQNCNLISLNRSDMQAQVK